jgi:hypothetical protein
MPKLSCLVIGIASLLNFTHSLAYQPQTIAFQEIESLQEPHSSIVEQQDPEILEKKRKDSESYNLENQSTFNSLRFQLKLLKLPSNGNNALFLGRTEKQGADFNNHGLGPKNIVNEQTRWVFIDAEERERQSLNDLVIRTENLVEYTQKIGLKDPFLHKFKLIVIDSGAAEYILTNELLDKLLEWIRPHGNSTLIFENPNVKIYPTCIFPFDLFSLPLEKRKERWQRGETVPYGIEGDDLRAYPNFEVPLSQIFFDTSKENVEKAEEIKTLLSSCYVLDKKKCNFLQDQLCDNNKLQTFQTLLPQFQEYFLKRQTEKLEQKLKQHFHTVNLVKNEVLNNSAPFVKDHTYYPALNRFWWIASGKITPDTRDDN